MCVSHGHIVYKCFLKHQWGLKHQSRGILDLTQAQTQCSETVCFTRVKQPSVLWCCPPTTSSQSCSGWRVCYYTPSTQWTLASHLIWFLAFPLSSASASTRRDISCLYDLSATHLLWLCCFVTALELQFGFILCLSGLIHTAYVYLQLENQMKELHVKS